MADSKLTALTELSVADFSDDLYVVNDTGPTSNKLGTDRLFGLGGFIPGGRLTLTTGVPVTTADVTAAGTLYYTPYLHDRIRIYDGTRWIYYVFTERSLALTLTSGKNYDVFIYDNAGTLTLELSAAWTNDTTRADALTTQDGVQVKSGATTRLWLGLIRASGANVTEESVLKRFVSNAYNEEWRLCQVQEATSHAYNSATYRYWNNDTGQLLQMVLARAQVIHAAQAAHLVMDPGEWGIVALQNDWTSGGPANTNAIFYVQPTGGTTQVTLLSSASGFYSLGAGYHFLSVTEAGLGAANGFTRHVAQCVVKG